MRIVGTKWPKDVMDQLRIVGTECPKENRDRLRIVGTEWPKDVRDQLWIVGNDCNCRKGSHHDIVGDVRFWPYGPKPNIA